FSILWIALRHRFHGAAVRERARTMIHLVAVLEERFRGGHEIALARRLRAGGLRLLDRLPPALEGRGWRRRPDLRPVGQGEPPVRDRTIGIGLGDLREGLRGLEIPER